MISIERLKLEKADLGASIKGISSLLMEKGIELWLQ